MLPKKTWLKVIAACVVACGLFAGQTNQAIAVPGYNPISPDDLSQDATAFFEQGAQGYLVWQYSGDNPNSGGTYFGNDPYSFFRRGDQIDTEICQTLAELGLQYNNRPIGVGVNSWNIGEFPPGVIQDHMSYLKNDCGIKTIRVFVRAGGVAGFQNVLAAADEVGLQVIGAIGDYSNGGGGIPKGAGGDWYAGGYQQPHDGIIFSNFVNEVAAATAGYNSLFGLELANEPHCGNDTNAVGAYNSWATTNISAARSAGVQRVGLGQAAGLENSVCDNPAFGNFAASNSTAQMSSAHYYNETERSHAFEALAEDPTGLFYIGEAGWGSGQTVGKSDYYLYPIEGLAEGDTSQIASSLIDQGYEVSCSTPKITAFGQVGGYFDLAPPDGVLMNIASPFNIDFSEAKVPVWRAESSQNLMDSMETFWGFQDTNPNELQVDIASSPIYGFLSPLEQCRQKVTMLETIERMCQKLENPDTCALYRPVSGTDYTTQTMLAEIRASGFSCEQSSQVSGGPKNDLYFSVLKVPFFLDRAYRVGFIVMAAELQGQRNAPGFFHFLTADKDIATPKHEIRVMAFKIPDTATNKDFNSDIYYQDGFDHTRNIFLDPAQIQELKETELERRRELLNNTLNPGQNQVLIPPINCQPECGPEVAQALVDMINANGVSCQAGPQDLRYETSSIISSDASLETSEDRVLAAPESSDPVETLANRHEVTQTGFFDFLSQVRISPDPQGKADAQIVSYLVLPLGTNVKSVEDALIGYANDPKAIRSFKADPEIEQYFKLSNVDLDFDDNQRPQLPVAPTQGHPCLTETAQAGALTPEGTCDAEAYVEAEVDDHEPRIPGGLLGAITQNIQRNLYQLGTKTHNYILSCLTTEQFLTGRCLTNTQPGSTNASQPPTDGDIEYYCLDWNIRDWSEAEKDSLLTTLYSNLESKYPYTLEQPTRSQYQQERYEELLTQTHTAWNGQTIPPDKVNYFENYFGGGRALMWTVRPECNNQACYRYVAETCADAGFNPGLCIAMNLSESGGSNHVRFAGSYDFGCLAADTNDIAGGLDCLINRFFTRDTVINQDYNGMFEVFAGEGLASTSYDNIRTFYNQVTEGTTVSKAQIQAGQCQ